MAVARKKKTIAAIRKRRDAIAGNHPATISKPPHRAESRRAIARDTT
jgi:hypothetical protein